MSKLVGLMSCEMVESNSFGTNRRTAFNIAR
ncbi:MAG: hypothetical protein JWQ09_2813 [Segetibacter sp.]|nr:hypothetical protein [Segetibacter sp.]